MGFRRPATAMIFLLSAGFARAQVFNSKAPKADEPPKAGAAESASEAPAAPGDEKAAAAAAKPPESIGAAEKSKLDSAAAKKDVPLDKFLSKSSKADLKKADLVQKLAPDAPEGSLKDLAAEPGAPPSAAPSAAPSGARSGGTAATVTPEAAAANAAAAPAASARSGRAMRRASTSAAVLRSSFQQDSNSAMNGGTAPAGSSLTGPAGAKFSSFGTPSTPAASTPGSNPAQPRTASDLLLASHTGFAASIRDQGYKVGPGPGGAPAVLAADGRPATPAQISRLASVLSAEPTALMRRPDFFEVLPRPRFEELKADYRANPAAPGAAFQDIGMTEGERDFRWSASCSALSGGCNPVVRDKAYRKGEDVPPEDLNDVWKKTAAAKEDEIEMDDYTDEDRQEVAAAELAERKMKGGRRTGPSLAGLLAGLGEMADDARDFAGFGGKGAPGPAGSPEDAVSGSPGGGARSSAALAAGEARGLRAWTVPSPPIERKASRRGAAGAAAGLAAAVFFLWRRSRSG